MDLRSAVRITLAAGALAAVASVRPARAQDADSIRARLLLPDPPSIYVSTLGSRAAPGSSSGSPSAFGPNWGDGFVGGGMQTTRAVQGGAYNTDGSVSMGFGLGNSRDYVGLEVDINSLSTLREGPFQRTAFGFKVHRVLPGSVGLAVGWENGITIGGTDGGRSVYGVISKVQPLGSRGPDDLFNTLTVSLGAGNGRFRTLTDVRRNIKAVNAFGSVGVRVKKWASVIADWPGQDLTLAASFVPIPGAPLVVTPGFADVLGRGNRHPRFTMGAGMGFKFADVRNIFLPTR